MNESQFQMIISYLGMGGTLLVPQNGSRHINIKDSIERRLSKYFIQTFGRDTLSKSLLDYALINSDMLMNWALWETSSFLIRSKLKTSLGTPLETLQSLDKALTIYLDFMKAASIKCTDIGVVGIFDILNRLKWLSKLIEFLKIQIYNAAKSCSNIIPVSFQFLQCHAPSSSRQISKSAQISLSDCNQKLPK
jgi:hypothetical protein